MAAVIDIGTFITTQPGVHGGRPIIAGTGVTVQRIAVLYNLGYSPEEIARKMDHLTIAQIYAALTFYLANRDTIEAGIRTEDEAYERLQREHEAARPKQP